MGVWPLRSPSKEEFELRERWERHGLPQGGVECSPCACFVRPRRRRHLWFIGSHFLTIDSHHQNGTPSHSLLPLVGPVVQDGLNEGWQKLHWEIKEITSHLNEFRVGWEDTSQNQKGATNNQNSNNPHDLRRGLRERPNKSHSRLHFAHSTRAAKALLVVGMREVLSLTLHKQFVCRNSKPRLVAHHCAAAHLSSLSCCRQRSAATSATTAGEFLLGHSVGSPMSSSNCSVECPVALPCGPLQMTRASHFILHGSNSEIRAKVCRFLLQRAFVSTLTGNMKMAAQSRSSISTRWNT